MKQDKHTTNNTQTEKMFIATKWQRVKNCDTKTVSGGWLWIKFNTNTTLISVDPNVIGAKPCSYKAGKIIGFQIRNVSNRRQAIEQFNLTHQIIH